MATSSTSSELLQAYTELYNLGFGFIKPMALQCAVKLDIPNAISKCGGSASLTDLLAIVPVPEHRKPYLPRLMRFLAATGILALDAPPADESATTGKATVVTHPLYRLTPVSRLLVDDVGTNGNGCTNLSSFVLSQTTKYHLTASMHLSEWFEGVDGSTTAQMTPFKMAYGMDVWEAFQQDPRVNEVFNTGLASDSQVVLDFVATRCREVFDGITSLVDVGGGIGIAARTIAKAFPHIKCSVLDLPSVISSVQPVDGTIEYIAGDMMDSIPPTDAVLLKYVLHDWNDEECVKILTQCKKAICRSRDPTGGKVIIIDTIVGSASKASMLEVQVSLDLLMMVMTSGKERDEHEWRKIFKGAGFGHYNARPVMGFLSIIELYP
ncbi:unnamed protein product [Urochloa humidicola]